MTSDEILADLNDRLDRAMLELRKMAYSEDVNRNESIRLAAKANGLALVKDWLRSYPPENEQAS